MIFKDINDRKRMELSDSNLLMYYKAIRRQHKWGTRGDETLCEYINELEYRGLRYRL